MVLILLVYFGRAFFVSRDTAMTPDELLMYAEAQLPSIHSLWWTLQNIPTLLDPPLDPTLSFFAFRLPLPLPLSLRVPPVIAYGAFMLSLYVFVRRRAPASMALIAAVLPMPIPMFSFAVQARPYALVLAFSGWALVFWQRAAERRSGRAGALIGLYLSLTCALLSNYLAGLVFVPLVAGEIWRSFRERIDTVVWAVFAAAALAVLTYIPYLPATAPYRAHPWHGVFLSDLGATYLLAISPIVLAVLSICALLCLTNQEIHYRDAVAGFYKHEIVAIATFYCVPVFSFAFAKVFAHSYVPRYSLIFGIAACVLISGVVFALARHIRSLSSAVLLVLLICASLPIATGFAEPRVQNTDGIQTAKTAILDRVPALPVAVTDFDDYERLYLYAPDRLKRRMILVFDPSAITGYGTGVALATEAMHRALNAPEEHYREFLRSHSRFLLLGNYWMRDQLLQDGWNVVFLGQLFYWDLYEVTSPSGSPAN